VPAYRCAECGIHYPAEPRFTKCPIHGELNAWNLWWAPDTDWEAKAAALRKYIDKAVAESPDIMRLNVKGHMIQDDHGQWWLPSAALFEVGVHHRLPEFTVFEVPHILMVDDPCDCLWEVGAYLESKRAYWVRPLRVPDHG
jgi:hypothetical protein